MDLWLNVNEDGVVYDAHTSEEAALAVQEEFPNDTIALLPADLSA